MVSIGGDNNTTATISKAKVESSCFSSNETSSIIRGARLMTAAVALLALLWAVLLVVQPESQSHPDGGFNHRVRSKTWFGKNQRRHGILCFGDSLTAGTSGPNMFPYAKYLQEALDKSNHNHTSSDTKYTKSKNNSTEGESPFEVRHVGIPGWTAEKFVEEKDHPERGLRTIIKNWPSSSSHLDLVIILAGTNDLGKPKESGHAIAKQVIELHKLCYQSGVPRTIVLAIPPSNFQVRSHKSRAMAAVANGNLKIFAKQEPRATFVNYPFEFDKYDKQSQKYWHSDGLHFSELGYKKLGQYLKPYVLEILNELD
ncbi:hypothetical protein ACA910_000378 [Epithemia clementina (nom. ined.)]